MYFSNVRMEWLVDIPSTRLHIFAIDTDSEAMNHPDTLKKNHSIEYRFHTYVGLLVTLVRCSI